MRKIAMTYNLDHENLEELEKLSKKTGKGKSAVIRDLISEATKKIENSEASITTA